MKTNTPVVNRKLALTGAIVLVIASASIIVARKPDLFGGRGDKKNQDKPDAEAVVVPTPAPATSTAPATPTATPATPDYGSSRFSSRDYRSSASAGAPEDILLRKSIFSKDRRPAPTYNDSPVAPAPTPAPPPPGIPILVGILHEDSGYIAYLEDPDSGRIWPFAAGDPLPGDAGKVAEIGIDYIDIAKNDQDHRIDIGKNIAGESPASPAARTPAPSPGTAVPGLSATPTTAPPTTTPATPATAAPVDTSNLTMEEKMKLRRQQQLGK